MVEMNRSKNSDKRQPIRLAEKYAYSEKFNNLFAEGMKLVDESAAFLDGPGRAAVKDLSRTTSLLYGTESLRLTTRLMQLASWLLLQRAANEGELSTSQVFEEKEKVNLENLPTVQADLEAHNLPKKFIDLIEQSIKLQSRIVRLDKQLYNHDPLENYSDINPVNDQIELISSAFEAKPLS